MSIKNIKNNLGLYKQKFYLRQLSKGVLLTLISFVVLFFLLNGLETIFWFDTTVRFIILIIIVAAFFIPFILFILTPLLELFKLKKGLSNKQIAKNVGDFFPEIEDKLLNLLELEKLDSHEESLISASIKQKEDSFKTIDFSSAINLKVNIKYLYTFLLILFGFAFLSFIHPIALTDSTKRIILFQEEFERPMPFKIEIENSELYAYKNEDYTLNLNITGSLIPEKLYLITENGRKIKLVKNNNTSLFKYTWRSIQKSTSFQVEAIGFTTKTYNLMVIERPEISDFLLEFDFPSYTGLQDSEFKNIGNATIPEGTIVRWVLNTMRTSNADIILNKDTISFQSTDNQLFKYAKKITQSSEYEIRLANEYGENKTPVIYNLDVIKDEYPEIEVKFLPDSILFSSVIVSGKVKDDYGFSKLILFHKSTSSGEVLSYNIPFNNGLTESSFIHYWNADSTGFPFDDAVEIWLSVYDNDKINGAKSNSSRKYYFKRPSKEEVDKIVDQKAKEAENNINETQKKSTQLNKQIEDLENRLKNKNELGWQEQKMIQNIIDKKKEIEKSLEELKKQHEELLSSEEKFDKKSERIAEKSKQLQKLMNELLNEETKALYDELQKLLEDKSRLDEVSEQLSKIKPSEENLEKELERALELFKKLKLETKIEQTAENLKELSAKQTELAKQKQTDNTQQEIINDEFEKIKKSIEEIEKLNQELSDPEPLDNFNTDEQEISEELEEASEELNKKGDSKKSKSKQQNAGNKMQQLATKMQEMQNSMEMEMMEENMENLRDILDNLVKGSIEQERIILQFRDVSQSDPRFIELSQDQLRLVENTKITEDSLRSLANRVLQISNFVTREIDQINRSLENAMSAIKDRNKNNATNHQQFAMTSMNNLALLLDDVMQQMQAAMSKGGAGSKKGKKKGNKPSMSELQKQLSKQIQELKKSGKSGRQLSEELAKMAAEQSRIREGLKELQQKLDGQGEDGEKGGQGLKEAIEKMEQNENDLVNKRLTQNLINRQEEIISRMLESEESMREQDQDNERKGETANKITPDFPPAFEEYLKARQSEIELLNSIPLDLSPFYKKEVNKYFRKLSVQEN